MNIFKLCVNLVSENFFFKFLFHLFFNYINILL
nr:MAG TPA: hypothetical protein [Caudoviricetes sp.]